MMLLAVKYTKGDWCVLIRLLVKVKVKDAIF